MSKTDEVTDTCFFLCFWLFKNFRQRTTLLSRWHMTHISFYSLSNIWKDHYNYGVRKATLKKSMRLLRVTQVLSIDKIIQLENKSDILTDFTSWLMYFAAWLVQGVYDVFTLNPLDVYWLKFYLFVCKLELALNCIYIQNVLSLFDRCDKSNVLQHIL